MESGVVDQLVVAVTYAYDRAAASQISTDFKGLAGLAASVTAALVGITIATARSADEAHDAAAAVGMETSAYTALVYAVERSGGSVEALRTGLGKLNMQVQASRNGSKEAAKAFAELGLDPARYANGAEALGDVQRAMAGLSDEGTRAQVRLALFGEQSGKLAEYLALDADAMDALAQRAQKLGAVIGDEAAEDAGRLMDNLGDLGHIVTGLTRNIGFGLAPRLADLTGGMVDWYLANADVIDQQLDRVVDGIGMALDGLQSPMGKAVAGGSALALAWGGMGVARSMYDAASAASPLVKALGGQAESAKDALKAGGLLGLQLVALGLVIDDVRVTAEGGDSVLLALGRTMGVEGEVQGAAVELVGVFGDLRDAAFAFGPAILEGTASALEWLGDELPFITGLVDDLAAALRSLDVGGVIEFVGDRLKDARTFTQIGTRALKGESTDIDRAAFARFEEENVIGNLSRAIRERGTAQQGDRILSALGLAPPVNVSINANSDRQIARVAGEQAARAVEAQALQLLGMME